MHTPRQATPHVGDPDVDPARPRLPEIVRVLLAPALLLVAIFTPYLLLLVPAVAELARDQDRQNELIPLFLAQLVAVTVIAVGLLALVARHVDRVRLRDYGIVWDRRSLRGLLVGVAVSVAIVVPVGAALSALGWVRPMTQQQDVAPWIMVLVGLFQAFFLQGIPEEWIFRGYLITTLQRRGIVAAVWISALVFGVLHLASSGGQENLLERVLYLAWPFGFGLAAGALRLTTGSLWAAVGIHGGSHVGVLIAQLLGFGVEGPAGWLLVGAAYTAVGVWGLARYRRAGTADPALAHAAP